jgi:hypothetical protein
MKEYKKLQIIKHALQYYVERPGGDPKDFDTERLVLKEVTEEVERLKERYGIKSKEGGPLFIQNENPALKVRKNQIPTVKR